MFVLRAVGVGETFPTFFFGPGFFWAIASAN